MSEMINDINRLPIVDCSTKVSEKDLAQCLSEVSKPLKPSRVRKFKEDIQNELTIAKMELHVQECNYDHMANEYAKLLGSVNSPTITQAVRLLVKAVVRKWRGV